MCTVMLTFGVFHICVLILTKSIKKFERTVKTVNMKKDLKTCVKCFYTVRFWFKTTSIKTICHSYNGIHNHFHVPSTLIVGIEYICITQ